MHRTLAQSAVSPVDSTSKNNIFAPGTNWACLAARLGRGANGTIAALRLRFAALALAGFFLDLDLILFPPDNDQPPSPLRDLAFRFVALCPDDPVDPLLQAHELLHAEFLQGLIKLGLLLLALVRLISRLRAIRGSGATELHGALVLLVHGSMRPHGNDLIVRVERLVRAHLVDDLEQLEPLTGLHIAEPTGHAAAVIDPGSPRLNARSRAGLSHGRVPFRGADDDGSAKQNTPRGLPPGWFRLGSACCRL